jgi:hypothetical protein
MTPKKKARRGVAADVAGSAAARITGARAIQANAGCPNLGKLSANSAPERRASA